jgi:peroxiredoxin
MEQDFKQFTDREAQIVVIAPHEREKVRAYWEKENISFIGIPDPDGKIGKRYGQEWNLMKLGRMPALFIIDQKGIIAFSQYANNMADIPENDKLLQILFSLRHPPE